MDLLISFQDVNEAFSILSDSQKRHRYDNGLDVETGGMSGGMGDIDPTVIFQQFFGGGGMGGMGGMGGSPFGSMDVFFKKMTTFDPIF